MKIFLIKSSAKIFKYNKTFRLNIFNRNVIFYNKFCEKKSNTSINLKNSNQENNDLNIKTINLKDTDDNILKSQDFENEFVTDQNSVKEIHKNIQLRLYEIENIDKKDKNIEENSLVEKKDLLNKNISLPKFEHMIRVRNQFAIDEKNLNSEKYQKSKIGVALAVLLIGCFSLWVPLYKSICESQGFSTKTTHQDYRFKDRKCKNYFNIKLF